MNLFKRIKKTKSDRRVWANLTISFISKLAIALIIIGLAYIILYPLLFCISNAFKLPNDMYDNTIIWLPKHFTTENFIKAWNFMDYGKVLINTINVSLWPTLLQMFTCALAGYGFARFKFKGKGFLFILVLLTVIVPPQTISISLYTTFRYFDPLFMLSGLNAIGVVSVPYVDLTENLWAVILPALFASGLRSGLFVFVYRQFFSGFPKELEEAAHIDGCSAVGTFFKILVPNAVPAFTTVFLFSLVWYWNDYFTIPLMIPDIKTLPTVLGGMYASFTARDGMYNDTDKLLLYPMWRAGIILYVLPLLTMFLILQRKFVESVERTGIVG